MAVPPVPRCKKFILDEVKEIERTSSLHKYVICDLCKKKEANKKDLQLHLKDCALKRTCLWCNIVFKNRGNLFSHTSHIHGKGSGRNTNLKSPMHTCPVCPKKYTQKTNLKYHIRGAHYNMVAKIADVEKRKINEVWLEKVLNSNSVIEIKKVKLNMYLMRKASIENPNEISESKVTIDLSPLYPTHVRSTKVWCEVCQKDYYLRDFQKHVNEKHKNIRRHECNNCNKKFQRSYQYLKHNCKRKPKSGLKAALTNLGMGKSIDNITLDE